ncbi:hypothetical protein BDF19DRAFT_413542 [Syncephalis fuscata]|nr:hypothetical protein BDF19DRAFT_413542 [Syncephalis fuscata]
MRNIILGSVASIFAILASAHMTDAAQCSFREGQTISNQAQLDSLAGCSVVHGPITISGYNGETASFNDVRAIEGNLIVDNNFGMRRLILPNVKQITGDFTLRNNTQLKDVDTPNLKSASRIIAEVNPVLTNLGFPSGLAYVDMLRIVDSMIKQVNGLVMEQAGEIEFSANRYLTNVNLDNLKGMSGRLLITDNSKDASFRAKKLNTIAGNVTMTQLHGIDMPSLTTLGTGFHLHQNLMQEVKIDNLTSVAQSLSIYANEALESASFHSLETIGGALLIADNPSLKTVSGFPNLKTITGSLEATGGPFKELRFENLQDVAGAVKIQSSEKANCRNGELIGFSKQVVKGKFECKASMKSASTGGNNGRQRGIDSDSGAASGLRDAGAVGDIGILTVAALAAVASYMLVAV